MSHTCCLRQQTICRQALICHRNNVLTTRTKINHPVSQPFQKTGTDFRSWQDKDGENPRHELSLLKVSGSWAASEASAPAETVSAGHADSRRRWGKDQEGSQRQGEASQRSAQLGRDLGAEQGYPWLNGKQVLSLNPPNRKADKKLPPSKRPAVCSAGKFCQTARHKLILKL